MKSLKLISIGLFAALIMFIVGFISGMKYISNNDQPKIVDKVISDTKWKDKYLTLKQAYDKKNKVILKKNLTPEISKQAINCMFSPLNADETIEMKYSYFVFPRTVLTVRMYDDCKEATARYEIGQKGNWKIYTTIAVAAAAGGAGIYYFLKK